MANSTDRRIDEQLEETQAALRRNIEEARELTDRAQRLIQKQDKSADRQR